MIRNGHEIMETNYNVPKVGEIDIISQEKDILVFTDVKTQTAGTEWGDCHSQIDEKKSDRVMNAVQHYMDEKELECDVRFNIGDVELGKGRPKIRILEEALSVY